MANLTEDEKITQLRNAIRSCINEASGEAPSSSDTLNVSQKPDMSIQSTVVEITKAAAYGMERIELLKKRDFPTHKAANAAGVALDALETIFKDMLKHPMSYLDEDPAEKVAEYEKTLADEEMKLSKSNISD